MRALILTGFSFTSSLGSKIFVGVLLTLLMLTLFPPVHAVSEPPLTEWTRTYGSPDGEWAYSVIQTEDGGYAIGGATAKYSWPERGYVNYSFLLIKTDASGNMQWNKTYGGEDEDDELAYSIIQTGDGGYAFAGETYTDARYDAYLVKIAPPPDTTPTVTFPWWTALIIIISFLAGIAVTTIILRRKQRG